MCLKWIPFLFFCCLYPPCCLCDSDIHIIIRSKLLRWVKVKMRRILNCFLFTHFISSQLVPQHSAIVLFFLTSFCVWPCFSYEYVRLIVKEISIDLCTTIRTHLFTFRVTSSPACLIIVSHKLILPDSE